MVLTKLDDIRNLNCVTHYRYANYPLVIPVNTLITETKFVFKHDTKVGTPIYAFQFIFCTNGDTDAEYPVIRCISERIK